MEKMVELGPGAPERREIMSRDTQIFLMTSFQNLQILSLQKPANQTNIFMRSDHIFTIT